MTTRRPPALAICDDGRGRHVWAEPFSDGDTCACGRFYLDLHSVYGFAAEVQERQSDDVETEGAASIAANDPRR
jgi:hypothetical protein